MPTKPPGTPDLDLTDPFSSGSIDGAVFMVTALQSAGSGTFHSFVQVQHNGSEQGYNTDASAQFNEGSSHTHNHSILLADVPIVIGDGANGTIEGVAYREFLLDLNEQEGGSKRYISLDELQIWQEEAGNLTNFTPDFGFAGAHTNYLAYDLDAGGDKWIALTDDLSHGSGESDYRILIPDSFFINDTAHRYVTLYSQFGLQPGWSTDGGFEEWAVAGESGGAHSALAVHKTATVDGGTADTAGEVINYAIAVSNTGNTALTGITVTDPSVSNLAPVTTIGGFNVGDTNLDNQLSAGETWQYTANHTVTQDDIDSSGGGDGIIQNTVTADSNETGPSSAGAIVLVDRRPSVDLTKTADVTSVDAAGDVIAYSITVENTGNATLSGVEVTDTQVNVVTPVLNFDAPILGPELLAPELNGDYNVGDTNENGVEDPGETFVYHNAGDTNQNDVEDPGETFQYTNVGDTNQNGAQDDGETFQYYNAGDTDQDGVEDDGETFQYTVSHNATPVDADENGFNDGDTNNDGNLSVGETWQYTVSYTVTQDDIDNGGVVQPGLTHDNTATVTTAQNDATDSDSEQVLIVQDPRITLVKAADVSSVDSAGDEINYTINVTNDGNMTLTGLVVSDPSVSDLAAVESGGFNVGDADQDGKLDLSEMWQYTAHHTVTQDDIDNGGVVNPALTYNNTASVTTDQGRQEMNADPDANDTGSASVPIVQNPHVTLTKSAAVVGGVVDAAGDVIHYRINVTNDGNMTLTNPVVSDPSVTDLAAVLSGGFNAGDTDQDGKLDLGETWKYTASYTATQDDIDNGGVVNPALTHDNTASVTTDQGTQPMNADPDANDTDSASVPIAQNPHVVLDKTATVPGGTADTAGEVISYSITIHNDGNMTLTNPVVSDPSVSNLAAVMSGGFNAGDADQDGKVDVGETWQYSASHTVTQSDIDTNGGGDGTIDNTASVTTDQGASSNDSASVPVEQNVEMTFVKAALGYHDANNNNVADAGDTIDYSFTITNAGNTTLHQIGVSDTDGDVSIAGSVFDLAPGATDNTSWSGSYVIAQTDVDAGYHDNTAVALADEASTPSTAHVILSELMPLMA